MIAAAKIFIEFQSYWIAGGGRAGAGLDIMTECDDCGCPAMPMSQVKGTLREAATRLWRDDEIVALFGAEASRSHSRVRGTGRNWRMTYATGSVSSRMPTHGGNSSGDVSATKINEDRCRG